MKGLKIALIGILSMLVLFMSAVLWWYLDKSAEAGLRWNTGTYGMWEGACTLKNTREIDVTQVSDLKMNFVGTGYDIYLEPSQGQKVILEEYFSYDPKQEQFASVENGGKTLAIHGNTTRGDYFFNFGINRAGYVKLLVPPELFSQLDSLVIKNSSGGISLEFSQQELAETMNLKLLELSTSSGDIKAPFLRADTGKLNASSGQLKIGACEGDFSMNTSSGCIWLESCVGNLELNSSSGDKKIGSCVGDLETEASSGDTEIETCRGYLSANASSGTIKVRALAGGADIQTTSGGINLTVEELLGDISLKGSSGGVTLSLPQNSSFIFDAQTSSGSIHTYFDEDLSYNKKGNQAQGIVGTDAAYSIRCGFTSGSVRVTD